MFPNVSHHGLTPLAPGKSPEWKGRAVLAGTPLSFILQHFLDRVAKIAAQTEGWRQPGTRIVSGSQPSQPHVVDVWVALLAQNGGGQQAVHSMPSFSAQEVVFPCRCPLIHPFFNERLREIMRLPQPKPLEQRKVVLYFSRN
ncbi:Glycosyltransferase uncharacterized [Chlorella sorokiniana]|uniref:Glycosyltransferase uncharacterized n=1 Tax=Chlorella sorokiniana TaxID=3076 RepID=A0A2P6U4R8_CHLSO|nr:Glycosyltransferase uncharacterized [Chlorella sorokiniana]|eukprot:PRW61297.1 Glycosyltransferase uncharacterized [Chlorella sorokiniana]